jgi:hypothetical protein
MKANTLSLTQALQTFSFLQRLQHLPVDDDTVHLFEDVQSMDIALIIPGSLQIRTAFLYDADEQLLPEADLDDVHSCIYEHGSHMQGFETARSLVLYQYSDDEDEPRLLALYLLPEHTTVTLIRADDGKGNLMKEVCINVHTQQ